MSILSKRLGLGVLSADADVDPPEVLDRSVHTLAVQLPPILIVEDDVDQAHILQRVLSRARIANPVVLAHRGEEADAYMAAAGAQERPLPVLVLLDLHLPGWGGLDFLDRMRKTYDPQSLPVVILSGSPDPDDIDRSFELGANSYLVKPVAFDALIDTLENLALPRAILPPASLGTSAESRVR
jgi:DNA-binding response OmpR family regulator